ncbi:methyltransferase [Oceaniferula spumae]|uniref:Methyltransferase n=1 Tax=Oceaniferula spumae TaxID=2979115 RepID=A0AAT9FP68_9BACT
MTDRVSIARKISALCADRGLRFYTKAKLLSDPLYGGVLAELKSSERPLLDVGCGIGILGLYLRENGWDAEVSGFDYDDEKIEQGLEIIKRGGYERISLAQGDARTELPEHSGNVTILDILQFFTPEEQKKLLRVAGSKVKPGGKFIIRSGLKEKSVRFFITWIGDLIAKGTFWMKAAPTHYPTAQFFREQLESGGFEVEIRPFWGKTPFNNYLIVATRQPQSAEAGQ